MHPPDCAFISCLTHHTQTWPLAPITLTGTLGHLRVPFGRRHDSHTCDNIDTHTHLVIALNHNPVHNGKNQLQEFYITRDWSHTTMNPQGHSHSPSPQPPTHSHTPQREAGSWMLWSEEPSQRQLSGSVWAQDAWALFPAMPWWALLAPPSGGKN